MGLLGAAPLFIPAGFPAQEEEDQAPDVVISEGTVTVCSHRGKPDASFRCDAGCSVSSEPSGDSVPGLALDLPVPGPGAALDA